jgi:hypothetical protein
MEWFWASIAYACLAAIGGFAVFVMLCWFAAARSRALTRVNARERG